MAKPKIDQPADALVENLKSNGEIPDLHIAAATCGIVMPISSMEGYSSSHWSDVKSIILSVVEEIGILDCDLVSYAKESGLIHKRIVTNLYSKDLIICDVSGKNPNVLFELGLRLAFDKPTIIIKDDITDYIFDTSPIEHLTYPRTLHYLEIQAFKDRLRDSITSTFVASKEEGYSTFVKHFGILKASEISETVVPESEYLRRMLENINDELIDIKMKVKNGMYPANIARRPTPSIPKEQYYKDRLKRSAIDYINNNDLDPSGLSGLDMASLYDYLLTMHRPAMALFGDRRKDVINQIIKEIINKTD